MNVTIKTVMDFQVVAVDGKFAGTFHMCGYPEGAVAALHPNMDALVAKPESDPVRRAVLDAVGAFEEAY